MCGALTLSFVDGVGLPELSKFLSFAGLSRMDDLRYVAERKNERFEIIEGRGEGFYVVRYVDKISTHDYLQNSVTMAQLCAEDKWGVPTNDWREPLPNELPLWQQTEQP